LAAGSFSRSTAAGNPGTEGLNNFRTPAAFLGPAIATVHYPTATHYRYAHIRLEGASPDNRGGPHSKKGSLMDAQTVGGGYDRWLIFQTSTQVPTQQKPGERPGKIFNSAARALAFFCLAVSVPPPALEVTGDLG
jgi:hypothetical protein